MRIYNIPIAIEVREKREVTSFASKKLFTKAVSKRKDRNSIIKNMIRKEKGV